VSSASILQLPSANIDESPKESRLIYAVLKSTMAIFMSDEKRIERAVILQFVEVDLNSTRSTLNIIGI
jgi:hypothetical protein